MNMLPPSALTRRRFVLGSSSLFALSALPLDASAKADSLLLPNGPSILSGNTFDLHIDYQKVNFTGKKRVATTVNGSFPAPTLRWKEGERVTLRVTNHLKEESSIHWHGIILPSNMDGSPGFDFTAIQPGETFEYQFDVKQNGTYWYHSHSGFQEQTGLFGAIIIDPKEPDPVSFDREMVVQLSDWSDEAPSHIYANLKKMSAYYNFSERTLANTLDDVANKGIARSWRDRSMWKQMRMSDRDIADVSGYTYTYLINGVTPKQGWMGLYKPGEKIRIRFINAAAMSIFDVRIPGLKMTVVAADGQNIQPVVVDEFRIAVAETYDVIVEPASDSAYTLFAQSIDRSGYARATLTSNPELQAVIPAMDPAPILTHADMGMMDMSTNSSGAHDMSKMQHSDTSSIGDMEDMAGMDMSTMNHAAMGHTAMDHAAMNHKSAVFAKAGFGRNVDVTTGQPTAALLDPGIGLREHATLYQRKVLNYADIRGLHPTRDKREPTREIELHLTGNMHRYMWSFNSVNKQDSGPLLLAFNERVRIILVNDTMMTHPVHLHGMWSELETGDPDYLPRKHTIIVQPSSTVSYLLTADAKGNWAYHCHLLYHMLGMMRTVKVV